MNHTPDLYDELPEFSTGATKTLAGNSVMITRNMYKISKSLTNAQRSKLNKKLVVEFTNKKNSYQAKVEQFDKMKGSLDDKTRTKMQKMLDKEGENLSLIKRKINHRSNKISIQRRKEFNLKNSTKATVQNQSRKLLSSISNQDDFGSKAIGQSSLGIWSTYKYRHKMASLVKKPTMFLKHATSSIVSFISSLPAIISYIITSIPIMLIFIVIMIVLALFGADLEYSGRILNFSENEVKLENAYKTALIPDEILAITQVLGWTTQNIEDYEILLSFALDQKRGTKPNFDEMLDNIFQKYNPANYFSIGSPIHEDEITPYSYYHNEEGSISNLGNSSIKKRPITNKQYLNIYPEYKDASTEEKRKMGTERYMKELKSECKELLMKNGFNYLGSFLKIDSKPDIFESELIDSSKASVSSVVGYRDLNIDNKKDSSFHQGTDIAAAKNTPIYAVMDATVIYADGSQTLEGKPCGLFGSGNSVILKKEVFDSKGNAAYLYVMSAHLEPNSVMVHNGQKIKAGDRIGAVGTTGTSTGNHVHFQVWLSNKNIEAIRDSDWVNIDPKEHTDHQTAKKYTIDDEMYYICLDGLMFYDIEYRNQLFNR